jgi:uncharacterized protein (TIGR03437 family)
MKRALWVLGFSSWLAGQTIQYVPGSTTPRFQLTGEHFQIQAGGKYFSDLLPSQTLSRYGVLGTDLGFPVTYGDKILLLFGDTVAVYSSSGRYMLAPSGPNGSSDSIGYIPNTDFSGCRYIGDIDQQLAQGVERPVAGTSACPAIRFYTNPAAGANDHAYKSIVISGLQADENQSTFRVPISGLVYNDRLYLFYTTQLQDARPVAAYVLQSIVAKADQPLATWTDTNMPGFTRLYTVSSHAPVADPANPPPEAGEPGKFILVKPLVMDSATLAGAGLTSGLPSSLRNASSVVFLWATTFRRGSSNLYLAAFALADIEAGPSKWFYYRGNNQWTANEREAAPLLSNNDFGDHSVVWNSVLRRFALLRTASPGVIQAQFSAAPWGPWSDPATIFSRGDSWGIKLLHHPGLDQIVQSVVPIYNRDGTTADLLSDPGVPYGPHLLDKSTQNADGSLTIYYLLSTWNPYQVFLMSSTFRTGAAAGNAATVNAASFDSAALAPGTIASLFGTGLADSVAAAPSTDLPTTLAGVTVMVRDSGGANRTAPLFFVSPGQVNFLIPPGAASGSATVTVNKNSQAVATSTIQLSTVAPAIFTANADGKGVPAAYFATSTNPLIWAFTCGATCVPAPFDLSTAAGGAFLVLYGTGIRNHGGLSSVRVAIGGITATVTYAGSQNQYPGLDQINVQVPAGLVGKGEVDVVVVVNDRAANTVRVAFR